VERHALERSVLKIAKEGLAVVVAMGKPVPKVASETIVEKAVLVEAVLLVAQGKIVQLVVWGHFAQTDVRGLTALVPPSFPNVTVLWEMQTPTWTTRCAELPTLETSATQCARLEPTRLEPHKDLYSTVLPTVRTTILTTVI
jgi:hypothetical protein